MKTGGSPVYRYLEVDKLALSLYTYLFVAEQNQKKGREIKKIKIYTALYY